jgi:transposase
MSVVTIGLDLAKPVFQVHGVDSAGQTVRWRRLGRTDLLPFFCEAGALRYRDRGVFERESLGRELTRLGH